MLKTTDTPAADEQSWLKEVEDLRAAEEARIAALDLGRCANTAIEELTLRTISDALKAAHCETVDALLSCNTAEEIERVNQSLAELKSALRWADATTAALP